VHAWATLFLYNMERAVCNFFQSIASVPFTLFSFRIAATWRIFNHTIDLRLKLRQAATAFPPNVQKSTLSDDRQKSTPFLCWLKDSQAFRPGGKRPAGRRHLSTLLLC
jgi:hypothetical protein